MLLIVVLQVVLPVALLLWLALRRHPNQAAWVLAVVLVASLLLVLHLAGLWLMLPWYLPALYGVVGLFAAAYAWRQSRDRRRWPHGTSEWVGVAMRMAAAGVGAVAAVYAALGGPRPDGAVDVAFPLRQGTYLVANGGRIELRNAHLMTLTEQRFRAYRGQSFGVDLVRIDRLGRRARGLQPSDPAEYTIFGDSVFAPCAGHVVRATDGLADQPVPEVDRAHMAGNYVLLNCGDAWVLLGHLRASSVRVSAGETVLVGAPLGRVGNTGNTSEPHLHIHAQRPGTDAMPLGGEPLPIRFDGRRLARNDRISGVQ
jgi:hypothetical protein